MELRSMNLERSYGAKAEDIAECIGRDPAFDEKVIQLSPARFETIMSAYKKKALRESKTALNELLSPGGKVFKDTNDYYLADHYIREIIKEAFEYGSFKVPGEKDSWDKANEAYTVLMRYLIDNDQSSAQILDGIRLDQPEETLTLDKFIDSKKEETREAFSSYRQEEYKDERFDRIFSGIKKEVKTIYEDFKKNEARRLKKEELLLSTTQKINILIANMNKQTEHRTKAIEDIANTNKEKALDSHTLTQKHNFFHGK